MFEKIYKCTDTIKKHIDAPLLEQRLEYLRFCDERIISIRNLGMIASYLLRIVEYLNLETNKSVTHEQVESAANTWAKRKNKCSQEIIYFSKYTKKRFMQYALEWLKRIDCLTPLVEENTSLFIKLFKRWKTLKKHINAPLQKERLMYLQYLSDNGTVLNSLQSIAQYLLLIMQYMQFYQLRDVDFNEIEQAATQWESQTEWQGASPKLSKIRFIRTASGWFELLGCLLFPKKIVLPFEEELNQYITYMRHEKGLAEITITTRVYSLQNFLQEIWNTCKSLIDLTPLIIDNVLIKKHDINNCSRRTVQEYASTIRSFIKYKETQNRCSLGLSATIQSPRVYKYASLPSSPCWEDVKILLKNTEGNDPTDIRDHAILMLLSVYGLRCSEVKNLRLEDIDWENELLHLKRAKTYRSQTFPLVQSVGNAILRYIKEVRQNQCHIRSVFLCMYSPYRSITNGAVYRLVRKQIKPLGLAIQHYGPHALRHACASRLINEGVLLKEISDQLGHQNLESTRIYLKVDLTSLQKIADFDIGDLL